MADDTLAITAGRPYEETVAAVRSTRGEQA